MTNKRKKLGKIGKGAVGFRGVFVQFGGYFRRGELVRTMLVEHITDSEDNYLCDHTWIPYEWHKPTFGLRKGDMVKFRARLRRYALGKRFGLRGVHKLKKL